MTNIEFNYNNLKILSITSYLLSTFNFPLLHSFYQEYLLNSYSKKQYSLILLLSKSYQVKNIFKETIIYQLIENYIVQNTSKFIQNLIFK